MSAKMWGPLTVRRHAELIRNGVDLHVLVDGVDVTNRCRFADDRSGFMVAELYKHDERGHAYLGPPDESGEQDVAVEVVRAGVEIVVGR